MTNKKLNTINQLESNHSILLFDGVCNLCNNFVQFVIKRDKQQVFRFAALQSDVGQQLLHKYKIPPTLDTVVLIQDEKAYTHSDVALHVAKKLGGVWPLIFIFVLIPSFIRNPIYNWIAKNRYRWFGKQKECMIPTPSLKALFLDS